MCGLVCYTTRMSTTHNNEETPRPEPKPTGSRENRWEIGCYGEQAEPCCPRCGNSEDAPNSHELCENCVEAMEGDGWDHWDRVRECDSDAFADSIDRD